jgi:hypothetical protein
LLFLVSSAKNFSMKNILNFMRGLAAALIILFFLLLPVPLFAVETVKSPVVEQGLLEFEQKGKRQYDQNPNRNDENEYEANAAYGITQNWKAKLEATFEQKRQSDFHYKSIKMENFLNLNGKDVQHEIIVGFYQDINFADRSDSTHFFTLGILVRRDFGKFANIGNLYVKRDFGDTAKHGLSVMPRWQSKYSLFPYFEPGFEVIGDTQRREAVRDWNLIIGPMFYGSFAIADVKGFGYEIGTLFGATPASHDVTLKWKLKYAFAD